jgi:pyruvate dehydrogenase E1 component
MVSSWSDEQIWGLQRGGHDYRKLFAAYTAAVQDNGRPTVILAKTIKGWTLGSHFEGRNSTHQMKKMTKEDILTFRDRLQIPLTDDKLDAYLPSYYKPPADSPEAKYLAERRQALGGSIPRRRSVSKPLQQPDDSAYESVKRGSGHQEIATTMAFVRMLKDLIKDPGLGARLVPIIPDEARTFGLDSLFPTLKIYSPNGQKYMSVDRELMLSYKESTQGVILHEGINEAGSVASFTAVGSSYSTHDEPMIPIYIFYSMFGFQRTGDAFWAAADQRARGFLIGATSGRTTLGGEGLQHQDGSSHLMSAAIPNCISYDPAYAYELAVIIQDGMERMLQKHDDVFYYITVTNENEAQPSMPANSKSGILRGMHCVAPHENAEVRLLASGPMLKEAIAAAQLLKDLFKISAAIWSVTSYSQLARDGIACERAQRVQQSDDLPWITQELQTSNSPVIAVSDYVRAIPESVRAFVPSRYVTLGTDGFGRSDTRANLRDYFEVDAKWIAYTAMAEIFADKKSSEEIQAIAKKLGVDLQQSLAMYG